jgi:hypothetical protein
MSAPTSAALRHWTRLGQGEPRQRIHAISSAPASRKRVPIWKNGGRLISANLIAR